MKTKILVISNAAMNHHDSNGRTILKLLSDFDNDSVAQFYTYGVPDTYTNNYKVSDKDAFKSFVKLEKINGRRVNDNSGNQNPSTTKKNV